jgi:DNA-binding response OmpR family regulator
MTDTFPGSETFLLLDSDPLTRTILQEALEGAGYFVMAAGNIGAAVDRLKKLRPDLLIVRPYIDGMSGHMAAQYLRSRCPGLPVLMVGGFVEDDRTRVRKEIGDFHIFPQPFTADELLRTVKDVLRIVHEKSAPNVPGH